MEYEPSTPDSTVSLPDNWVFDECGAGYQARGNSPVPFRALIIWIIFPQRVWVDDGAVQGFLPLISQGEIISAWVQENFFSLGGPV